MTKLKSIVAAAAIAAFTVLPAGAAQASHTCGLQEFPEVNTICENYHNPKPLIGYLICLVSPTC